jgi:SOS-response transcriptional repressor LexA
LWSLVVDDCLSLTYNAAMIPTLCYLRVTHTHTLSYLTNTSAKSLNLTTSFPSRTFKFNTHRPIYHLAILSIPTHHTKSHSNPITQPYHTMPLPTPHRCQICGDVLFHDNLFSDPSQHFCLTVNGPGMVDPHAEDCEVVSTIPTSLVKLSH